MALGGAKWGDDCEADGGWKRTARRVVASHANSEVPGLDQLEETHIFYFGLRNRAYPSVPESLQRPLDCGGKRDLQYWRQLTAGSVHLSSSRSPGSPKTKIKIGARVPPHGRTGKPPTWRKWRSFRDGKRNAGPGRGRTLDLDDESRNLLAQRWLRSAIAESILLYPKHYASQHHPKLLVFLYPAARGSRTAQAVEKITHPFAPDLGLGLAS